MTGADGIWLVVPAYNEREVIGPVVSSLVQRYGNVIVVDDCSTDDTAATAASAGCRVVSHPVNLGQGAALQTGIDFALSRRARIVVTFDADGQHRIEDVDAMLELQRRTQADVVLGSRFLGRAVEMPPLRRVVLKLATSFTNLSSGLELTDTHNGLRVLTRAAAEKIEITQNRMAHASEMTDQIARHKLKVVEAPVTIVYTEYSLRKGQRLGNAVNILLDLLMAKLGK